MSAQKFGMTETQKAEFQQMAQAAGKAAMDA